MLRVNFAEGLRNGFGFTIEGDREKTFWIWDWVSGEVKKIMRQCFILFLLLTVSVSRMCAVDAAERAAPVRIGVLTEGFGPTTGAVGLRDGLKTLAYRENKDFVIGVRFTQGDASALPAAARELLQRGVDLLFTEGRSAARAAQMETKKVPIVFAGGGDPVGLGLIQSFARPGGNITGVTDLDLELGPKRLEIFKEMIPGLKRPRRWLSVDPADDVCLDFLYREWWLGKLHAQYLRIRPNGRTPRGQDSQRGESWRDSRRGKQ